MKRIVSIACSKSGHNFVLNQIRSWNIPGMHPDIINWENMHPEHFQRTAHNHLEAGQLDPLHDHFNILIIRDLLNWWASYLKFVGDINPKNYHNVFHAWTGQVQEAFTQVGRIGNKIVVEYDRFKAFKFEREALCAILGGTYSESRLDEVAHPGGGSSFDKYDVPGSLMRTDLRWKQVAHENVYWNELRKHPEAVELYKEHFFITPEKREQILDKL